MNVRSGATMLVASSVMLLVFAWSSQVPVSTGSDRAIVRLSWRSEAINIETCRTLSEEEAARLPSHMRRTEECEGRRVDYEVTLAVDETRVVTDTVRPSGARRDRPVYVFRDYGVAAGSYAVSVAFTALVPPAYDAEGEQVRFEWSDTMVLSEGQIGLVTLDAAGGRLIRR